MEGSDCVSRNEIQCNSVLMSLTFVPEGDDIAAYWVKTLLEWFYEMLSHIEDFGNDELFK